MLSIIHIVCFALRTPVTHSEPRPFHTKPMKHFFDSADKKEDLLQFTSLFFVFFFFSCPCDFILENSGLVRVIFLSTGYSFYSEDQVIFHALRGAGTADT